MLLEQRIKEHFAADPEQVLFPRMRVIAQHRCVPALRVRFGHWINTKTSARVSVGYASRNSSMLSPACEKLEDRLHGDARSRKMIGRPPQLAGLIFTLEFMD